MSVRIRLMRIGRRNRPSYRICAFDARTARGGRALEILGHYDPLCPREEDQIKFDKVRLEHWLARGALPSETVASICRRFGVDLPEKKKPTRKRKRGVQRGGKTARALARKQGARQQA